MKIKVLNSQTLVEIQEFDLNSVNQSSKECTIGRSPHSGLVLDSPDVSRLHGKFIFQDGEYSFCDLGSKNGSIFNGKVALTNQRHILRSGDVIRLGEFVLTVEEIVKVTEEELPQTVVGGLNDTAISGWQMTPFDDPIAKPTPVKKVESSEAEPMAQVDELESKSSEVANIKASADISSLEVAVAPVTSLQDSDVINTSEAIALPAPSEVAAPEISSYAEPVIQSEDAYIQAPEPVVFDFRQPEEDTYIQAPEPAFNITSEPHKEQRTTEEISVQLPNVVTPPELVEVPVKDEDEVRGSEIPEELNVTQMQTVEENSESEVVVSLPTTSEKVEVFEVNQKQVVEEGGEVLGVTTPVLDMFEMTDLWAETYVYNPVTEPEAIAATTPLETEPEVPEIQTSTPEPEVPAEVVAQPPEGNKIRETISEKYIALMAHDTKKSELVQLVVQHQEFFSKCRTIATPSVSDVLSQETGITITQRTPTVPVGGFQTIASLVAGGEILAVIFLRDFLAMQTGQANEEALLRSCNVNQVLLATNVSTAEAIVHYVKELVSG